MQQCRRAIGITKATGLKHPLFFLQLGAFRFPCIELRLHCKTDRSRPIGRIVEATLPHREVASFKSALRRERGGQPLSDLWRVLSAEQIVPLEKRRSVTPQCTGVLRLK